MAKYLSQEWLDRQRVLGQDLPRDPDASAVVQHVVTGGPDGDVRYVLTIEEGMVTAATLSGWRGWLSLKQQELGSRGSASDVPAGVPSAASRIEIADLKERIRKLEAIAAGVDL